MFFSIMAYHRMLNIIPCAYNRTLLLIHLNCGLKSFCLYGCFLGPQNLCLFFEFRINCPSPAFPKSIAFITALSLFCVIYINGAPTLTGWASGLRAASYSSVYPWDHSDILYLGMFSKQLLIIYKNLCLLIPNFFVVALFYKKTFLEYSWFLSHCVSFRYTVKWFGYTSIHSF